MKKVFLGGTCNGSTWRDEIIPLLEIDYFNPVVDDWTPKHQEIEREERKECDFCLYVITPKMKGVYSIAEAIDDSNKKPGKTIFVLLREHEGLRFDEAQWRSLSAVSNMIRRNGASVAFDLTSTAKIVNSKEVKKITRCPQCNGEMQDKGHGKFSCQWCSVTLGY